MRFLMAGKVALACLVLAACSVDRLTVPNYNSPTGEDIGKDPSALQLAANGILVDARGSHGGWVDGVGRLGRESYSYWQTEGRNTTTWLIGPQDPTRGAGNSYWDGYYTALRNIFNFKNTVSASAALSEPQKRAALGFAKTFEAYALSFVVAAHGNYGAPVEIKADPRELAPFVSRDSVYNYIIATLDEAKADLAAGGSAFPFSLNSGFSGFTTPANFLKFNRALAARINARRAAWGTAGCGGPLSQTCYQLVLQNLSESFIDPANLAMGPKWLYSTQSGDTRNPLSEAAQDYFVAHPSILTDAQLQADDTPDQRYKDKIRLLAAPMGPGGQIPGIPTDKAFQSFRGETDALPIIRSEELVLLRSEANWFTGQKGDALIDLNAVRQTSGKLPATTLTTGSTDAAYLAGLLYERRYSLLIEGHRWVDVRRFNMLETLPIDVPQHTLFDDLIIPATECKARKNDAPSCAS